MTTKRYGYAVIAATLGLGLWAAVTATAQNANLTIGMLTGTPGQNSVVPLSIVGPGTYGGVQLDITYPSTLSVPNPTSACTVGSAPAGSVSTQVLSGNRLRVVIVKLSNSQVETFGDGTLANCTFLVSASAGAGTTHTLTGSTPAVSDAVGVALPATVTNGAIIIPSGPGCG
jgi:hypothetical protein